LGNPQENYAIFHYSRTKKDADLVKKASETLKLDKVEQSWQLNQTSLVGYK